MTAKVPTVAPPGVVVKRLQRPTRDGQDHEFETSTATAVYDAAHMTNQDQGGPKRGTYYGRGSIDAATRKRIRGWILVEMNKRGIVSIREMARKVGIAHSYLAKVLNEETTPGLELVLRVHRTLHISLDVLCDEDPPPAPFVRW